VRNKSTNKNLFLLVVRDLDIFRQTWQEVYRFLLFQSKQKNPKATAIKTDILGVFVAPLLSLPDKLRLIDSFGLWGVWSLCEIDYACCARSTRREKLDFLAQTLSEGRVKKLRGKDNGDQIFFPAFKESFSRDVIRKTLRALEHKYSCPIKRFFLFPYKTNGFRFEEL
jgi:hypothetical protein